MRQAFRQGRLEGRLEQLGGSKTRIWIDAGSVEHLANELAQETIEQAPMSTADVRIAVLESSLRDAELAAIRAEHRAQVAALEARVRELTAKVNWLLDGLHEPDPSVPEAGR